MRFVENRNRVIPVWTFIPAAVVLLGVAVWSLMLFLDPCRSWRSLLINFIYFTPLAAGMTVWPAVITAARGGEWLEEVKGPALAAVGFGPVSIAALIALWVGAGYWAPWQQAGELHNGAWLNAPFLFMRDLAGLVLFWVMAAVFVWRRRKEPAKTLGAWLVVVYCGIFSLLAFDLVMALDPLWYSSLFGGYYFISGMYIGIAGWTLGACIQPKPADASHRHDFGKLIVAFSLLTTYMMYSQLLPIWYENLPHEARFVVPRLNEEDWRMTSAILLLTIYLGPLVFLLTQWSKRSLPFLWGAATLVLAGMWVERWWLVTPTQSDLIALGVPEISLAAAFAGAFILSVHQAYIRLDLGGGVGR